MKTHYKNEFSKWLEESEGYTRPEFNKRFAEGVVITENADSVILQNYFAYRLNKSNQQLVKVTWILAGITALIGILGAIINLIIYLK
jgi:hypothetical protein